MKAKKRVRWADIPQEIRLNEERQYQKVKFRIKGPRNKNNPIRDIERSEQVRIVKRANYVDCLTCHFCISDNVYKVYDSQSYL